MSNEKFVFTGEAAQNYDTLLGPFIFEPFGIETASRVAGLNSGSVLETAAGTGRVTKHLRNKLPHTVSLQVTDINADMLEIARRRVENNNIQFQVADIQQLPFADNSFDFVVCQFGVMFLPDKPKGFSEMYRVLKPGGKMLVATWNFYETMPLWNLYFNDVLFPFLQPADRTTFYTPFHMHKAEMLEQLMKDAGFRFYTVEEVKCKVELESADQFVNGLLLKHQLGKEVEERKPGSLPAVAAELNNKIREKFGNGKIIAELNAIYSEAEK